MWANDGSINTHIESGRISKSGIGFQPSGEELAGWKPATVIYRAILSGSF